VNQTHLANYYAIPNPYAALQRAIQGQPLDSATDAAAVLTWRLQYEESRSPGPLPGLPPVPAQLAQHHDWRRYFDRRLELLARDAACCRAEAAVWTADTAPEWAAPLAEHDRDLTGELAVWRAVNAVPDTDTRLTGPPRHDLPGWRAQQYLDRQVDRWVPGNAACHSFSAQALADSINPRLAHDPHWPALARQLENAHHQGVDITAVARHAASERPLPDEQPAAALHWRIVDAIVDSRTNRSAEETTATSRPLRRDVARPSVDEPMPSQSHPRDVDYSHAFGNNPAPDRGLSR
jgi:hypothetical protein